LGAAGEGIEIAPDYPFDQFRSWYPFLLGESLQSRGVELVEGKK